MEWPGFTDSDYACSFGGGPPSNTEVVMRMSRCVTFFGIIFLAADRLPGQSPGPAPPTPLKLSDALAVSGGAELVEIRVTRLRKGHIPIEQSAAKHSLEVGLWF